MPVEGQWARQQVPLRRVGGRERTIVAGGGALAVGIVALLLYVILAGGSAAPRAGCVDVTAASTMGASRVYGCGAAAARICREEAGQGSPLARALAPQCARLKARR